MIKLVASDLDGTLLLNGAQELPEVMFDRIRELREHGIAFAAASGRQYANIRRLFKDSADDISYIAENGALAIQDDKVLYQDSFPRELLLEIIETIYNTEGAEFTCSAKNHHYLKPKTQHFEDLMVKVVKNNCVIVDDFSEMTDPCVKAAVYERGGVTDESIAFWNQKFGDRCSVVTSGNQWIDFIPFGTNKAKGVRKLQEVMGLRPEECLVIGDEYNDIEMLKSYPNSVAMSHSKPGVKDAAAFETESVPVMLKQLIEADGEVEGIL